MEKTLVLVPDRNMYFFPYVKNENVDVMSVCRKLNGAEKFLMRGIRFLNLPYPIFFGEWKSKLEQYTKIVLFDMSFTPALARYILRYSNAEVYLYLWNPIKNNRRMMKYINQSRNYVKVFSYDKDDCDKYGMNFAPMTYSSDLAVPHKVIYSDLTFLGYAKDRMPQIKDYYQFFSSAGLRCNFYVVENPAVTEAEFTVSEKGLSYSEYLDMVSSSHAILDLVQGGQSGLSLRVLEALFLKKKLVTGNTRVKDYDFYRPENIFILENNNTDGLKDFLAVPYHEVEKKIVDNYDFVNWLDRYFKRG